jgi:hypothetical protein
MDELLDGEDTSEVLDESTILDMASREVVSACGSLEIRFGGP